MEARERGVEGGRTATMSVDQAHQEYFPGLSRASVFRACASGAIPSIRFGRRILIPRHAVEKMLGIEGQPVGR